MEAGRGADVADVVHANVEARGGIRVDALGLPLLMREVGNRACGQRLSRRGVPKIVGGHLTRLDLKRPGRSTTRSATRAPPWPTSTPTTCLDSPTRAPTASYARVLDKALNNSASAVPIRL
jgi:hypothetical protein